MEEVKEENQEVPVLVKLITIVVCLLFYTGICYQINLHFIKSDLTKTLAAMTARNMANGDRCKQEGTNDFYDALPYDWKN